MSRADEIFIQNCKDILENGVWDMDRAVRPKWEDGTSAHTVKKFGIVNRYDLSKEFPILTIRRIYWKSAVDELLWIWQKKSNNVHDLHSHVWDAWADETGSIGKAYGYQVGVKHHYPEGDMDQIDKVLWDLKHNPASRRIITSLYTLADLSEMALYPCAYSMTYNVTGNRLNAILNQRSQDMLAANNLSVRQTEKLAASLLRGERSRPPDHGGGVDYTREAERRLSEALGRGVRLTGGAKKGRIALEFYSPDDREALMDALLKMEKPWKAKTEE